MRVEIEIWGERWARTGKYWKYLSTTSEVPNSSDLVDSYKKAEKQRPVGCPMADASNDFSRKTTIIHSIEGYPWVPILSFLESHTSFQSRPLPHHQILELP